MPMKIHSVVACCEGGGIGYKNNLPWRLKKEMSHFRKLTVGDPPEGKKNAVIMGRKTWESLPERVKPLPKRYNFVLSRTMKEAETGMDGVYSSLDDFMKAMESDKWHNNVHDILCIGGAEIYRLLFNSSHCGLVYCTRVLKIYECDVFMPDMTAFNVAESPVSIPCGVQEEADGTKWKVEVLTMG